MQEPVAEEMLAFAPPAAWVELHRAPPGCPWARPSAGDPAVVEREVFAPIAAQVKSLVTELERRCVALRTAQLGKEWHLLYVVKRGKIAKGANKQAELALLVGGPPARAPRLATAAAAAEWELAPELLSFYGVHNGFGPYADGAWGVEAVLPSHALEVLPAVVGWQHNAARTPIVEPAAFLAFFIDSVGHRRGYYRQMVGRAYAKAMDWDRETHQVGTGGPALAVISRELVRCLRA